MAPALDGARRPPPLPPLALDALGERDAFGVTANARRSAHFIARWGPDAPLDATTVDGMLAAFERAWTVQIEEMGHAAPDGTEAFLFNVYIGDTGGNAPSASGTAGYYTRDGEGYPFIVLSREVLSDGPWYRGTAAHEFYHAVQDEVRPYAYEGAGAWYWEATAEWANGEVNTGDVGYAQFLFGYAYLPELSVEFFDYPDTGALAEYHQYGAFIFPRYLSELAADPALVVSTWTAPRGATPMESIAAELAERGLDLSTAFGEFAATNATWDYLDGEAYRSQLTTLREPYGGWTEVADVPEQGTAELVESHEPPQRWGYNVVHVRAPAQGHDLAVTLGQAGSAGSLAGWRLLLVRPDGAWSTLSEAPGTVTAQVPAGEYWLVAAAVPSASAPGETFPWGWSFTPSAETGGGDALVFDGGKGSTWLPFGCASATVTPRPWLAATALGALLLARRPRRRKA
ncbi:MAG: hypothetical protein RLZZ299_3061 [Pseudomonadota bacterium]